MENKKTIIGIIIVIILIVALVVISYLYNDFSTKQLKSLTDETNILLQANILTDEIDLEIKTERSYAIVEEAIKEYLVKLKNIYVEIDTLNSQINPNDIFSGANIADRQFDDIDLIISDYKEKGKNCLEEYEKLIKEEEILKNIEEKNISIRKDYYVDLYKTAMFSEVMQEKFNSLQSKVEEKKDDLYYKLSKLEKVEEFLQENEKYWNINKEGQIEFTNINKMTEYYSLLNNVAN